MCQANSSNNEKAKVKQIVLTKKGTIKQHSQETRKPQLMQRNAIFLYSMKCPLLGWSCFPKTKVWMFLPVHPADKVVQTIKKQNKTLQVHFLGAKSIHLDFFNQVLTGTFGFFQKFPGTFFFCTSPDWCTSFLTGLECTTFVTGPGWSRGRRTCPGRRTPAKIWKKGRCTCENGPTHLRNSTNSKG